MKLLKIFKNLNMRSWPKDDNIRYSVRLNDEIIDNIKIYATRSHHDTYKILRTLVTPHYEEIFLLRNKKGFNTYNFKRNYDVIIAGRSGVILDLLTNVKSEFVSQYYKNAVYIFFAPVGTIKFYDLKNKDIIEISRDWLK